MTEAASLARKHLRKGETLIWADHARQAAARQYLVWGAVLVLVLTLYLVRVLPGVAKDYPTCSSFFGGGRCFLLYYLSLPALPLIGLVFVIYRLLLKWHLAKGRAHWLWALTDKRVFRLITWPFARVDSFTSIGEPPWPDALGMLPFQDRKDFRRVIGPITAAQNLEMRQAWRNHVAATTQKSNSIFAN